MEFCFEVAQAWVVSRNLFSSTTLPHTPSLPFPQFPLSQAPLPQSHFATIKVLGRFIPPQERPARSGHIVNLCVASFCSVWNGWAADSLVGLPQRGRKNARLQTAAAKKCSSWGLSAWCDSVFAQIACRPFSNASIFSQCHYKESTPERPSEALPLKTRSFSTETRSPSPSWKPTTPAILLHLSTILPLTGDPASSSSFWPVVNNIRLSFYLKLIVYVRELYPKAYYLPQSC